MVSVVAAVLLQVTLKLEEELKEVVVAKAKMDNTCNTHIHTQLQYPVYLTVNHLNLPHLTYSRGP